MILIGLVRVVFSLLGSDADTTVDTMVLLVLVIVLKRVGFRMSFMLV